VFAVGGTSPLRGKSCVYEKVLELAPASCNLIIFCSKKPGHIISVCSLGGARLDRKMHINLTIADDDFEDSRSTLYTAGNY
jgi:hypothetical protein